MNRVRKTLSKKYEYTFYQSAIYKRENLTLSLNIWITKNTNMIRYSEDWWTIFSMTWMRPIVPGFDSCTLPFSEADVFLGKGVLKMCSRFTGEHPCWSAISIKCDFNFIEIALLHGCSPVNLLHIFRTLLNTFEHLRTKNTFDGMHLAFSKIYWVVSVLSRPIMSICH